MSSQLGFAKLFLFLKENQVGKTTAFFHSTLSLDLNQLFNKFDPKPIAHQTVQFETNLPLAEAEKQIVQILVDQVSRYIK